MLHYIVLWDKTKTSTETFFLVHLTAPFYAHLDTYRLCMTTQAQTYTHTHILYFKELINIYILKEQVILVLPKSHLRLKLIRNTKMTITSIYHHVMNRHSKQTHYDH